MKVGDYVGKAGTWTDEEGLEQLGLIIDVEWDLSSNGSYRGTLDGRATVLLASGDFWDYEWHELEVMFEKIH